MLFNISFKISAKSPLGCIKVSYRFPRYVPGQTSPNKQHYMSARLIITKDIAKDATIVDIEGCIDWTASSIDIAMNQTLAAIYFTSASRLAITRLIYLVGWNYSSLRTFSVSFEYKYMRKDEPLFYRKLGRCIWLRDNYSFSARSMVQPFVSIPYFSYVHEIILSMGKSALVSHKIKLSIVLFFCVYSNGTFSIQHRFLLLISFQSWRLCNGLTAASASTINHALVHQTRIK